MYNSEHHLRLIKSQIAKKLSIQAPRALCRYACKLVTTIAYTPQSRGKVMRHCGLRQGLAHINLRLSACNLHISRVFLKTYLLMPTPEKKVFCDALNLAES